MKPARAVLERRSTGEGGWNTLRALRVLRTVPCAAELRRTPAGEEVHYGGLAGARVAYLCKADGATPWELGTTDANGRLEWGTAGFWRRGCTLEVTSADGNYRAQRLPIDAFCSDDYCHFLTLNVDMLPIEERVCAGEGAPHPP